VHKKLTSAGVATKCVKFLAWVRNHISFLVVVAGASSSGSQVSVGSKE